MQTIRTIGDPVLRRKARNISKVDASVRSLAHVMLATMYDAPGIGLAAPQIGISKRLVVVDVGDGPLILINPRIVWTNDSEEPFNEGCLSVPEVYDDVIRPTEIEVSFRDERGKPQRLKTDGLLARCIQHEIDHLNGILFVDKTQEA